jgi:hypothetical protein
VSEYQYYEFLAVDRPLDADQLASVRALSTRAGITPTSFVNVYHFGNFRGDPRRLVEQYYDAFLHSANGGTYQLMLRLPEHLLDPAMARRYCGTDSAAAWAHGGNVIVDLRRDFEDTDYWNDGGGEGRLASIIPARGQLATGDLRLLYLGWLLAVEAEELDDDQQEPPVPPNLAVLDGPLRSLVDFLHLDEDLLAVATETSQRQHTTAPSAPELASWIASIPEADNDALLLRVVHGDAVHLRTELLRRFHGQPEPTPEPAGGRTVGRLREAAEARYEQRQRLAEQARERERVRREREGGGHPHPQAGLARAAGRTAVAAGRHADRRQASPGVRRRGGAPRLPTDGPLDDDADRALPCRPTESAPRLAGAARDRRATNPGQCCQSSSWSPVASRGGDFLVRVATRHHLM